MCRASPQQLRGDLFHQVDEVVRSGQTLVLVKTATAVRDSKSTALTTRSISTGRTTFLTILETGTSRHGQ